MLKVGKTNRSDGKNYKHKIMDSLNLILWLENMTPTVYQSVE